jgi:hypothetical protein
MGKVPSLRWRIPAYLLPLSRTGHVKGISVMARFTTRTTDSVGLIHETGEVGRERDRRSNEATMRASA